MAKQLKRACVIGHFGFGETLLNGQTVKTKMLTKELDRRLGESEVMKIDTRGGIKTLFRLPIDTFRALRSCKNVVILPAHNGLRVVTPLLSFWNLFFGRSLHYAVIGGWLQSFLVKRPLLRKQLSRFTGIYVETETMRKALHGLGLENAIVMPNCKELRILTKEETVDPSGEPYRLCTFSRVMKEKGIGDAVEAVRAVNEKLGRTVYTLDIYGQVENGQEEWFSSLQADFPEYIRYCGRISPEESVDAIKSCFALLFPTRFFTEGIPGTIIDAYAAGVPVISARWESFTDLIEEGVTGVGYTILCPEELTQILFGLAEDSAAFLSMKESCLERAMEYTPGVVLNVLTDRMV